MKFECVNLTCQMINLNNRLINFTFKAKPTIDEKSQCPKCNSWCKKIGHSTKDVHIRTIDIMLRQQTGKALNHREYKRLAKLHLPILKNTIKEIEFGLEGLHG